jgi:hypothetical protein
MCICVLCITVVPLPPGIKYGRQGIGCVIWAVCKTSNHSDQPEERTQFGLGHHMRVLLSIPFLDYTLASQLHANLRFVVSNHLFC